MGLTVFLFAALANTALHKNPMWVNVGHLMKGLALTEVSVILDCI